LTRAQAILQLKHLHGTDTIGEHKKSKGEE